ncbi:MAG TPA: polyamine ABC transporter substrate-binding protein [Gammaproteobacteria bacterium]|nr:polyamine ABC transporter substrate-binding protein [Gammaproteobacteria bacterium]
MNKLLATAVLAAMMTNPVLATEKVLHIYNWSDYIAEDTIKQFEAKTGIKVTYDVYDSNEVLEAKMLAGSSGYDVVVPTSDFLQRQIAAGVYAKLDKSKLPNLKNMDPELMKAAANYDPGNAHAVIYMWGTTGIGYNIKAVAKRLGDKAPIDSWSLIFDPANAAKLKDCGISFLDASTEMIPAAMNYLGLDPRSTKKADLEKGAALLEKIRPFVRYFHSSQYISDLANGDICVAVGWSGDVFQARDRAAEAKKGIEIGYSIPKEGALQWFDMLAIPVDSKHKDAAHAFINFMMDAKITAENTNFVWYANANKASMPMVEQEIKDDPGIFPTATVKARLWGAKVYTKRTDRIITRLWTKVKTGK